MIGQIKRYISEQIGALALTFSMCYVRPKDISLEEGFPSTVQLPHDPNSPEESERKADFYRGIRMQLETLERSFP